MRCLVPLIFAISLTACTTDVFGPYAQSISTQDIQEIKALIAARPDIHQFVLRISATRHDCVYVETGANALDQTQTSFVACKQNGKWRVKEGSIEKWRVIVTS